METWRDVRRIALRFPAVAGANRRVDGRCGRSATSISPGTARCAKPFTGNLELVLIASDPHVFFTTPHFDGHPGVLIVLSKISVKQLRDVIEEAWLARAPKRARAAFLLQNRSTVSISASECR